MKYEMLPQFALLLNQSIDEKFHSFQRDNQMKKPIQVNAKEFVVMDIKVTFSLELSTYNT